ncbi:hypothetical protein LR48_Vigan01g158300 [Vigna angularis]|uniref:Transposase (putative) gypsy type domain-containing protein n=1 Tax=Phaseolus angularis TaxID=3914 RepID=A0A0L9TNK4_PHAAN|nr:hypothetical protein LR48_Vigan01g158300 [Vigna angularis]
MWAAGLFGGPMTWTSFRTAFGPCWYTSPPSPSARSARRTSSAAWCGLAVRSWAGSSGLLSLDFWRENTWCIHTGGRGNGFKSGALVALDLDGTDAFNVVGRSPGGSARSGGDSPSSVSSRFLDEGVESLGPDPEASNTAGDRIFHGVPLFLLQGGVRVDGSPFEPDGYEIVVSDWAPYVPCLYASAYGSRKDLEWRVNRTHIVQDIEDSRLIRVGVSVRNERVFYEKRSSPDDFFYVYVNFFTHLFIRVPFTKFQMAVLREVNVAPAQLHPNSWAAVQAFLAMCLAVGVTPTIPVFFHYFEPRRIKAFPVGALSPSDLEAVRTINALPRRISARHLVECLSLEDCGQKAFELMMTPAPCQSNYMASRKQGGTSSSSARPKVAPNAPRPPPLRSSGGRLPPVRSTQAQQAPQVEKAGGSTARGRASGPDPLSGLAAVLVDPSSEAATTSVAPLVRKRKDPAVEGRKDKEGSSSRSTSKRARKGKEKENDKERAPAMPLPGDIFSPAFSMSDRTKIHMSSSQWVLIEPLSEVELTNAMLEMSTRAASLAWYLKEFADRPGVEEDEYDKRIEQLEADLEKSKREAAEANDRLAVARGDHERLLEECSQLKAKVSRQQNSEAGLHKANRALTNDLAKANERITELEATIVFEHEEGFNKALRQASLLAGIQEPFALGFDIEKDVFYGVLVDLNTVDDEDPGVEGPSRAVETVEAREAEAEEEWLFGKELSAHRPAKLAVVPGEFSVHQLGFFRTRTAVVLRKELSVHRPAKLTVVPGELSVHQLGFFRARTTVVLRKELSVHRPAKLIVVPGELSVHQLGLFRARTTVVLRKELSVHRPAKLTVVLGEPSVHQLGLFRVRTAVVLRKELSIHRPAKLTVVPRELSVHQLGLLL